MFLLLLMFKKLISNHLGENDVIILIISFEYCIFLCFVRYIKIKCQEHKI